MRALASSIGCLSVDLQEGVARLGVALEALRNSWDDLNYEYYRQQFEDEAVVLLRAADELARQEVRLHRLADGVEGLDISGSAASASGRRPGARSSSSAGFDTGRSSGPVPASPPQFNLNTFQGAGDPTAAVMVWRRQEGNSCAVMSQLGVIHQATGRRLDAASTCAWLESRGWYDPDEGTSPANCTRVLDRAGIRSSTQHGATLDQLVDALEAGDSVIVGLNSAELWSPLRDGHGRVVRQPSAGGHAVQVTGVGESPGGELVVVMNDTGRDDGAGRAVSLSDFLAAWDTFGNFMVVAKTGPPT